MVDELTFEGISTHALHLIKQKDLSSKAPVFGELDGKVVAEAELLTGDPWDKLSWLGAFVVGANGDAEMNDHMRNMLELFFKERIKKEDGGKWSCGPWYWMQDAPQKELVTVAESVLETMKEGQI